MRINDDLSQPTIVHASRQDWVPSPAQGVERRMLFRIGEERARATSLVRYAPGSTFARHAHAGGEEFLVVDGVFQDETGDYPAGTYVRNPPGTSHAPASRDGCTIFVRLWQFRSGGAAQIVRLPGEGNAVALRTGALEARDLFRDDHEEVRIERWAPNATVTVRNPRGLEFLLLSGSVELDGGAMHAQDWGRLPAGKDLQVCVGAEGARLWIRDGALLHPGVCPF